MKKVIGSLLFFAGIVLFLYPSFREWRTQSEVERIISDFAQKEEDRADEDTREVMPYPELYEELQIYNKSLVRRQETRDVWSLQAPEVSLPDMERGVIGYIDIPDMKTRLPLYIGSSQEHLARGAAVMTGTSMPVGGEHTNCVIAGHRGFRGSAYFQYIENMKEGSRVYITTPWEKLTYQAAAFAIVSPEEVESIRIQEGKDMVTLVSCHPYQIGGGAPERYLVFCERIRMEQSESVKAESGKQMESMPSEKPSNFIQWEGFVRAWLPGITFALAGLLIFLRKRKA